MVSGGGGGASGERRFPDKRLFVAAVRQVALAQLADHSPCREPGADPGVKTPALVPYAERGLILRVRREASAGRRSSCVMGASSLARPSQISRVFIGQSLLKSSREQNRSRFLQRAEAPGFNYDALTRKQLISADDL